MIRGILATMSVLALAACASAPLPLAADATDAAQTYACAGGRAFTAAYDLAGDKGQRRAPIGPGDEGLRSLKPHNLGRRAFEQARLGVGRLA